MQINFKIRKNHIKSIKIHANKGLNIKKECLTLYLQCGFVRYFTLLKVIGSEWSYLCLMYC